MNFTEWLDSERGRAVLVAKHFAVTLGAVSQWKTDGVPPDRMRDVARLSDGAVSVDEMLSYRDERRSTQEMQEGGAA